MRRRPVPLPVVAVLLAALLAAALSVVLTPSTATAEEEPPQLRRQGRWLVDQHGRVVIVHGMNLVWKHAPYAPPDTADGFTQADAAWLADHGFNAARLGTLWAGLQPTQGGWAPTYLQRWQRVMDDLAEQGIWMQLDFHQDQWSELYGGAGMPGWTAVRPAAFALLGLPPVNAPFPLGYWTPEQSLFWDELWAGRHGTLDAWAAAWRRTAAHWRDQPYLMGYDLMNEPWAGTEGLTTCLLTGCPEHYTKELQPAMEKALRAIREVDAENVVWFEPQQFSGGRGTPTGFTAVSGEEQLGFSWHNYCPQVFFESQGLPGQDVEQCASYNATIHGLREHEAARMQAVGLMSEFAATDNVRAIEIDTAAADEHLVGWMHWAYKGWSDLATADPAQGLFANDADRSTTKPKVRALVRTYSPATCGEPRAMSFDPKTGAFDFRYLAGTCAGRPTEIFVSPLHYPNGYDVTVAGGVVAGEAEHHRLLVRAAPGAEVRVTLRGR